MLVKNIELHFPENPGCNNGNYVPWTGINAETGEAVSGSKRGLCKPPIQQELGRIRKTEVDKMIKKRIGRPVVPEEERRKPRSIKLSDAEWEEIQRRAEAQGISAAEYIRRKALAGA